MCNYVCTRLKEYYQVIATQIIIFLYIYLLETKYINAPICTYLIRTTVVTFRDWTCSIIFIMCPPRYLLSKLTDI